jgi:hypothetical protein
MTVLGQDIPGCRYRQSQRVDVIAANQYNLMDPSVKVTETLNNTKTAVARRQQVKTFETTNTEEMERY